MHATSPDTLTREERLRLLASLAGDRLEVAVHLAAVMGLRPKEWRHASERDVRWTTRTLRTRRSKIYRDQELPIPPAVMAVIEPLRGSGQLLAGEDVATQNEPNSGRSLKWACRRAEVPLMTWYGLRHTYATLLAARQPIHVVQAMLGHSSILTTQRYLHAREHDLRGAAEDELWDTGSR